MNGFIQVQIRDLEDLNGVKIGDFKLGDLKDLVELLQENGCFYKNNNYVVYGTQFVVEDAVFEIIIDKVPF